MASAAGDKVRAEGNERVDLTDFDALQALVYEHLGAFVSGVMGFGNGCLSLPSFDVTVVAAVEVGACHLLYVDQESGSSKIGTGQVINHDPALSNQTSTFSLAAYSAGEETPWVWARVYDLSMDLDNRRFWDVLSSSEVTDAINTRNRARVAFGAGHVVPDGNDGWFRFARVYDWIAGSPRICPIHAADAGLAATLETGETAYGALKKTLTGWFAQGSAFAGGTIGASGTNLGAFGYGFLQADLSAGLVPAMRMFARYLWELHYGGLATPSTAVLQPGGVNRGVKEIGDRLYVEERNLAVVRIAPDYIVSGSVTYDAVHNLNTTVNNFEGWWTLPGRRSNPGASESPTSKCRVTIGLIPSGGGGIGWEVYLYSKDLSDTGAALAGEASDLTVVAGFGAAVITLTAANSRSDAYGWILKVKSNGTSSGTAKITGIRCEFV